MAVAPIRRTAVAPPPVVGVNFGQLSMYSGGAFIPEGNYIAFHEVLMHQAKDKQTGQTRGPERLCVKVSFYPLDTPTEEAKLEQFYSMGSKAHESYAPNPETGKGIVPVPGGKGGNLNDKTNWAEYLKSWYNSGLPEGIFVNDLSVLDGAHVHITNVDESAERATFASNQTSEIGQAERKPGKITVVTEILEGGAPWEGGGTPDINAATPAPVAAPRAAVKPVARPVAVKPAAAPAPVEATTDDADILAAAVNAASEVIGAKPNGLSIAALKTGMFGSIQKSNKGDEEMASAVLTALEDVNVLAQVVGELGYKVDKLMVKPA